MTDWRRLSVRDGQASDDGPYEGVPPHLYGPLREWVDSNFGTSGSPADVEAGWRLVAALRLPIFPPHGRPITVREVTEALSRQQPDLMLDVVDAALHLEEFLWHKLPDAFRSLDEILSLGESVWQVDRNGRHLVRRVDPAAQAAFRNASSPKDVASLQLQEAWTAAYGRNPDASDAWDHSIKAVEAVLIPIVTPKKARATLGDVVGLLASQGSSWQLVLHGHDGSRDVAPLVTMLRLMWPNPDRHGGGGNSRNPSHEEAQAVVNLAVAIVQWARAGALSKP